MDSHSVSRIQVASQDDDQARRQDAFPCDLPVREGRVRKRDLSGNAVSVNPGEVCTGREDQHAKQISDGIADAAAHTGPNIIPIIATGRNPKPILQYRRVDRAEPGEYDFHMR